MDLDYFVGADGLHWVDVSLVLSPFNATVTSVE
jgi:hypothetical protein